MIKITFKINQIRKQSNVTQKELSERTGIPQSSISRACMDHPENTLSLTTLIKYAEALSCNVKDLFDEEVG